MRAFGPAGALRAVRRARRGELRSGRSPPGSREAVEGVADATARRPRASSPRERRGHHERRPPRPLDAGSRASEALGSACPGDTPRRWTGRSVRTVAAAPPRHSWPPSARPAARHDRGRHRRGDPRRAARRGPLETRRARRCASRTLGVAELASRLERFAGRHRADRASSAAAPGASAGFASLEDRRVGCSTAWEADRPSFERSDGPPPRPSPMGGDGPVLSARPRRSRP
jgi:hypothetical protein